MHLELFYENCFGQKKTPFGKVTTIPIVKKFRKNPSILRKWLMEQVSSSQSLMLYRIFQEKWKLQFYAVRAMERCVNNSRGESAIETFSGTVV